jgi:regulator of replication initiation timing
LSKLTRTTRLKPERPPLTPASVSAEPTPTKVQYQSAQVASLKSRFNGAQKRVDDQEAFISTLKEENAKLRADHSNLKTLLSGERRRHGTAERLLTNHIERLEKQVSDLQQLFVQSVAEKFVGVRQ